MSMRINFSYCLLFCLLFAGRGIFAQHIERDSLQRQMDVLENFTDSFQEYFFEGLKQKAIENHEPAIRALERAEKAAGTSEDRAAVWFEIAKNQIALKKFREAEANLKKILSQEGNQKEVMEKLYDLYYDEKDYEKAIPLVENLVSENENYKEDLANLYAITGEYDKALQLLDEMDTAWGLSENRNSLRMRIYQATGNTEGAITDLQQKIETNPKSEQDYLNLIFLYSEQDNQEKAYETAQDLLKKIPESELAHLALYKFYLENGNRDQAMESMKIVFASDRIDEKSKYRVLGDFIQFVDQHPEFEPKLEEIVAIFSRENSSLVYEKIGDYFVEKSKKELALSYYEAGIAEENDNYNLIKNTILIQLDLKKFKEAAALSQKGLEIFPAQALLFLLNGVANNELHNFEKALESLESGLDFLPEDPQMQYDFFIQMKIAFSGKGNSEKALKYDRKASEIKLTN